VSGFVQGLDIMSDSSVHIPRAAYKKHHIDVTEPFTTCADRAPHTRSLALAAHIPPGVSALYGSLGARCLQGRIFNY
jgi:hypothetical protein